MIEIDSSINPAFYRIDTVERRTCQLRTFNYLGLSTLVPGQARLGIVSLKVELCRILATIPGVLVIQLAGLKYGSDDPCIMQPQAIIVKNKLVQFLFVHAIPEASGKRRQPGVGPILWTTDRPKQADRRTA